MNNSEHPDDVRTNLADRLPDQVFCKPQLQRSDANDVDFAESLRSSLATPLHYPALKDAVFPGDRIAIAIQNGLPKPAQVISQLLPQLKAANVDFHDVIVVVTPRTARDLGFSKDQQDQMLETNGSGQPAIHRITIDGLALLVQVHHGECEAAVSYLMANEAGDAMHVNRALVDADVILPVGSPLSGYEHQPNDCLYPDFGSTAVQERFRHQERSSNAVRDEVELANNTLGAFFTIQIVVGPGDEFCDVISGARQDAINAAVEETGKLWEFESPVDSQIAVATIETSSADQSWDDFARAVITSSRVTSASAPIVIWSDLTKPPNRRIRKALLSQFEDGISSGLSSEMQHVAAITAERPIYLRSALKRSDVEELGLGFVESVDEVVRIAEPFSSGILLRDAHKCQPASQTSK